MFSSCFRAVVVLLAAGCLLSGCGAGNQWHRSYEAGEEAAAQNPPDLAQAERSFKAALAEARKDHLPDAQVAPAFQALGQVLAQEGKFAEAQEYLLRSLSLATATRMPVDENIALLTLLEHCYEQTRSYQQALQTQTVLLTYLRTEKSPFVAEYKQAERLEKRLKELVAASATKANSCCHSHGDEDSGDQQAAASLTTFRAD